MDPEETILMPGDAETPHGLEAEKIGHRCEKKERGPCYLSEMTAAPGKHPTQKEEKQTYDRSDHEALDGDGTIPASRRAHVHAGRSVSFLLGRAALNAAVQLSDSGGSATLSP